VSPVAVFGAYSRYYDLFYGDKPYAEEVRFVDGLLRRHGLGDAEILEIGCGTGRHALELARAGHRVHGIDLSETMLERAHALVASAECTPDLPAVWPTFELGDARAFRAGRTFDAVISLFHVMSYQVTNDDLMAAFRTAAAHLQPGGLFVFDCWYGPAVLMERPERRDKTLEGDGIRVRRIAVPVMRPNDDVCEVHYDITVTSVADGVESALTECHEMRYLFTPEIVLALGACGFDLVEACEFCTGAPLGFQTWNGCFVARKR